ncbi:MAG: hypothetical protein LBO72_04380, partial [Helicobacteraceae bacterium]|nr:hypothetical protein [Helicobacteraceae bacterium]
VGDVVAVQAFWSTTNGTTTITSGEYHDSLGNRYASNIYKSVGDLWWNTQCPNARNNAPYKVVVEYTKA